MATFDKVLYLVRHAKSSWDDPTLDDHDRPLAPRGRRAAQRMADHLRAASIRPDLVLCSSAKRAQQTLAPLAAALGLEDRMQVEPDLYGASAGELLSRLCTVDDGVAAVLVVAHNPGLQDLALELADDERSELVDRLRDKFPTGAVAVFVCGSGAWRDLAPATARLTSLITPRDLPD